MINAGIGIDIGGTKIAFGLVNEKGEVLSSKLDRMNPNIDPKEVLRSIIQQCQEWIRESDKLNVDIKGIGVGAPGPLNIVEGKIGNPPNLPMWHDFEILSCLKSQFHNVPIYLENDATAAAVGEKMFGAARENRNVIYITISTGIGAGIFIDGHLYRGTYGNAGDIGHIVIDPSEGQCNCGQYGCFEHVASGTAIERRGSELLGEKLTTKEVFDRYKKGDPILKPFVENVFTKIGMGCVSLINIFEPEKIVIGGGVSNVGNILFDSVNRYISQKALSRFGRAVHVVPTQLKKDVGLIGAASLVFINQKEKVTT